MEYNQDPVVGTPAQLYEMYPLSPEARDAVQADRQEIRDILNGDDARLLVIEGPCSLDSRVLEDGTPAALKAAAEIRDFASKASRSAKVIGRFPPRKPRTNIGHAGLQQKNRNEAHKLISQIRNHGTSLAIEILQDHDFSYYKCYLSLGWIGARDGGSTVLRHEVSNNSDLPMLFKTGEDGKLDKALDSIKTAVQRHPVEYRDQDGILRSKTSSGNQNLGIILRGGTDIKSPESLRDLIFETEDAQIPYLVDCAHSVGTLFDTRGEKSVEGQLGSLDFIIDQVKTTDPSNLRYFKGIMIESYLQAGKSDNIPGMSATDPCITIETAHERIEALLAAQQETHPR